MKREVTVELGQLQKLLGCAFRGLSESWVDAEVSRSDQPFRS
jgi:hypothetical protein